MAQMTTPTYTYEILEQLKHRLNVLQQDYEYSQVEEIKNKWESEQDWIRQSGLRVKDFQKLF